MQQSSGNAPTVFHQLTVISRNTGEADYSKIMKKNWFVLNSRSLTKMRKHILFDWFQRPFLHNKANWTRLPGTRTQTQGPKTANEIQCSHVSYITTQRGCTYNIKLHKQHKHISSCSMEYCIHTLSKQPVIKAWYAIITKANALTKSCMLQSLYELTVHSARCKSLPSFSKASNFCRSRCESIRHIG